MPSIGEEPSQTKKFVITKNTILAAIDVLNIEEWDTFDRIATPKGIIIKNARYTEIAIL